MKYTYSDLECWGTRELIELILELQSKIIKLKGVTSEKKN